MPDARTIMVGVRPEIAQSIIGLGLSGIITYPSLAMALTSLGKSQGLLAAPRRYAAATPQSTRPRRNKSGWGAGV